MSGPDFTIGPLVGRYCDQGVVLKWAEQPWHQARLLTYAEMKELGVTLATEASNAEYRRRLNADGDTMIDRERV